MPGGGEGEERRVVEKGRFFCSGDFSADIYTLVGGFNPSEKYLSNLGCNKIIQVQINPIGFQLV